MSRFLLSLIAALAWVAVSSDGLAQQQPPSQLTEGSGEVRNFGTLPYSLADVPVLRPEQRAAMRSLEDRQLRELRELEDAFEAHLRSLRERHAQEREQLRRSLPQ